jgi:glycosyltransferase involved in cell wall biosynthesis
LVPSLWLENVPLVIGEALRAGVPVLASDIGGIPEAVDGLGTLLPVVPVRWRHGADGGQPMPVAPEQPIDRWAAALQAELQTANSTWEGRSAKLASDARQRAAQVDITRLEAALEGVIEDG